MIQTTRRAAEPMSGPTSHVTEGRRRIPFALQTERVSDHLQAIRIAVRDRSPDLPVEEPGASDEQGLGLAIVAGLSSA